MKKISFLILMILGFISVQTFALGCEINCTIHESLQNKKLDTTKHDCCHGKKEEKKSHHCNDQIESSCFHEIASIEISSEYSSNIILIKKVFNKFTYQIYENFDFVDSKSITRVSGIEHLHNRINTSIYILKRQLLI